MVPASNAIKPAENASGPAVTSAEAFTVIES